jgi:hypothetical protein
MAETKNKAVKEKVLYFGPTIPGVAIENTVYSEMPDISEALAACPELQQLFVPESLMVKLYPIAEQSLFRQKGAAFVAYQAALRYKASLK